MVGVRVPVGRPDERRHLRWRHQIPVGRQPGPHRPVDPGHVRTGIWRHHPVLPVRADARQPRCPGDPCRPTAIAGTDRRDAVGAP
ncbi:MAG: hypothetical protein EBZ89_14800, partial [Chloroflexi bacterium]|nr:hypothetical protein [Chloroflexota bacterium]